jgi:flagellar biosynthesis protein FlhF
LNIRKFIGATSRDALRLVREALGADAVVLSNRTMDDGSVEIVALADSELASIAPKAAPGASLPALPAARQPLAQANPYANGMPDVFSAVFGASQEVVVDMPGAVTPAALPEATPADDAPQSADAESGAASAENGATPAFDSSWLEPVTPETGAERGNPAARAEPPRSEARAEPRADDAAQRPRNGQGARAADGAQRPRNGAAPAAPRASADTTRTMAETNPWLIDHARKIAAQKAGHVAKTHPMTPAAAAAKGLGTPGKVLSAGDMAAAAQPDWAREATQSAARRAASRLGLPPSAVVTPTGGTEAAGAVTTAMADAVRARMEQVVNETVMNELSSLRGMMEEHFAGLMWGDRQRRSPTHGAITKHLFAAGFSAQLVQMVIDKMPEVETMDAGMDWVHSVLATNLPVMENEEELMERGGVFALMGPTGVGKTTTTAKLAARCVMRFGASKVALLTTDSYRIGGHEQLRIFGKILGVSVHAVKDAADLQLALAELRNKHIVLIDTIGMSQRDRTVSDHIAMLCGAGQPVQRLLLLNATSHGDTLNEVVQAYRSAPGQPELAGCILTKLDEATNLGSVLDAVIRYKLPVHYVSTGQKVPENLYVATKKFLIKSAFCIPRDGSPFVPEDDNIPALLSALSARSTSELHEVRFG